MSDRYVPLTPARLAFSEQGLPFSADYDDFYHSRSGALGQARYVFLGGNGLPARWQGRRRFTVCETGFGTGNNFLALWHAWKTDPHRCAQLHVLSFEGHPFDAGDMARLAARTDPDVQPLAQALAQAWPVLVPGIHRLSFEGGAVTLTLVFGPIQRTARQADACVDAFFLDGFAPDRNPDMWSPALFGQLARMAAQGATAATWCSAAVVRKALGNAGFLVSRKPGFASKWEMSVAVLRPGMGRVQDDAAPVSVAVVGAGITGAAMAHALALRGHDCTVLDPALALGPAGLHQGHRAAAMSPILTIDDDSRSRLSRAGVLCAARRWADLAEPLARPLACGTLTLAGDADERQAQQRAVQRLGFPADWVQWLDAAAAGQRAGMDLPNGGLYFPQGRLLRPDCLLPALMAQATRLPVRAARLCQDGQGGWLVLDDAGMTRAQARVVVLANAAAVPALLAASRLVDNTDATDNGGLPPSGASGMAKTALPRMQTMQDLAGQISFLRAQGASADAMPRAILAGNGYWLPADRGRSVVGSTYAALARDAAGDAQALVSAAGHADILDKLSVLSGQDQSRLSALLCADEGWGGWRAAMADHLPVIGPVPGMEGVWTACAMGSRGLSWAPLAGEILAANLGCEPAPIERELMRRIAPR